MTIRLLDSVTIGQIAAGEVIERPASVVKELVENAIDAGARRIVVRVRAGGLGEIEVTDDGSGIAPDDLPRAVLRHATSKLPSADAFGAIATLGFRGEGLAAIVAVARTTIASRTDGAEVATAVDAFAETCSDPYPHAGPPGTRVVVRDLFEAVPARRAYLRTAAAEFARIAQWLGTVALAYPRIAFALEHDGRPVFTLPAADDPRPRLAHVFGSGAGAMLPIAADETVAAVRGWISPPGEDRPDRRAQLLFVNGRLLRSNLLGGAWSGAYRTFAMTGRYPYGVTFVEVPPAAVDPNVHPTKSDVRLLAAERVAAAAREAMSTALRRAAVARLERAISFAPGASPAPHPDGGDGASEPSWSASLVEPAPAAAGLRVLAQIDRTYILATDGSAIVLIDQHAAHERVVYEELIANAGDRADGEPLLVPFTFEVRPDQAAALEASRAALAAGGLVVEPFGERAYRIVATPGHVTHAGKERRFDVGAFLDVLDDEHGPTDRSHAVWASLACHSVARAGDPLALDEMAVLVERLQRCANPMHCPHGRPTIVRLEPDAIARLFKRL